MTPKEKAERLVSDIFNIETFSYCTYSQAKQCALIAVDEIIIALNYNQWQNTKQIDYFIEVKQEIENL
jgi:hypothetical protein